MTRVLLIGGSGQLGTAIARGWSDCEIESPSHERLGLEDESALAQAFRRSKPDVLVNAAAFHDVDRCEREPETAFAINATAVGSAARLAAKHDAAFVTLSTDYVFDGAKRAPYLESDVPNPLSTYAASKLAGERLVAESGARAFVVRTCGVYGPASSRSQRTTFVDRVLAQGAAGEPVRVVDDVVASPTFAGDLAGALRRLIESRAYGLYHAAGSGAVSWYDFAREAVRLAGGAFEIEPISAQSWKAAAVRPHYSALENAKLRELEIELPTWREGIAAYLELSVR